MSSKKKTPVANKAVAKLDTPNQKKNGEELVTVTRQQVDAIKLAAPYAASAPVQAAVATLTTSTDAFEKTLSAIVTKKAELAVLVGTRDVELATVHRDRSTLGVAITANAQGSADAIKAWNCFVSTKTVIAPTTEAPTHLVLKNDPATPGAILARCKAVKGGVSYVFVFTADANAVPGAGTSIAASKTRASIAGQPLGHVVYARVAVVRSGIGQSAWSEAVSILVR